MNEKNKARLKDDILKIVADKAVNGSVYEIADKLKRDVNQLPTYLKNSEGKSL